MALSLADLQAAFKTPERGNTLPNNYYTFWNMKNGESAIIRFLPDKNEDNPLGFLQEKHSHHLTINGERKTIPCLKMYDEDCPICAVSAAYYKDEDKENGKKYWRKGTHLAQALIVEDPLDPAEGEDDNSEGKVRYISLSWQIYNVIKQAFEDGELDDVPFAYEGGCDFIIKKTKQGEYASYQMSKFAKHESNLDADQIEFVEGQLADLSELLPANPGREKVEAMLTAALTGEEYSDDKSSDDKSSDDTKSDDKVEAPKAEKTSKTKVTVKDEPAAESSDSDAEAEDILATIRARREKKTA